LNRRREALGILVRERRGKIGIIGIPGDHETDEQNEKNDDKEPIGFPDPG
jgi:hypothetical protein